MIREFNLGIVGTGMIAGVIAEAAKQAEGVQLAGVASRKIERAKSFAANFGKNIIAFEGCKELAAANGIDAVYVATPTSTKEEIALTAIKHGKHVLLDKPFVSEQSFERIASAAEVAGVALMDATHFSHNPRTSALRKVLQDLIGPLHSLRVSFFFPFDDQDNIRFDPEAEPTGAYGDMGWYPMRAAVEFLGTELTVTHSLTQLTTGGPYKSIVGANGLVVLNNETSLAWEVGYHRNALAMDLELQGPKGIITLDDFVLDWNTGFAVSEFGLTSGYRVRQGHLPSRDATLHLTEKSKPQQALMLEALRDLAESTSPEKRCAAVAKSRATQHLLDSLLVETANITVLRRLV